MDRLAKISAFIADFKDVIITVPFINENDIIKGTVAVTVEQRTETFEVLVLPQYPRQFHDMETIQFFNNNLIETDHVNWNGSICIHTLHSPDLFQKLKLDLDSLKAWMLKYLIDQEADPHYEHIVVPRHQVGGFNSVMLFTDVDHTFKKGDFGEIQFSHLADGQVRETGMKTYLLQSFKVGGKEIQCKWSENYLALEKGQGIYLFIDKPPVKNRRFALENWEELTGYLSQNFLEFLKLTENKLSQLSYGRLILMLGYPISESEIHWEMISIERKSYPNFSERIKGTRVFIWRLKDQPIFWGETKNCSYEYFFGRGALSESITKRKILLVGLGAVGSMVASVLCRGGCTDICLVDYDFKEPGNVCRSEYQFLSGINNKVDEMQKHLTAISPFINVSGNSIIADGIKILTNLPEWKERVEGFLNGFDLIIDCTADNDLAFLLSQLDLQKEMINLSITNYARELVCVTNPNLYVKMMHVFDRLKRDEDLDLYNPTGCWNPTFKASYNDISVLVQFAIKQINLSCQQEKPLRGFYLSTQADNNFNIIINQF